MAPGPLEPTREGRKIAPAPLEPTREGRKMAPAPPEAAREGRKMAPGPPEAAREEKIVQTVSAIAAATAGLCMSPDEPFYAATHL